MTDTDIFYRSFYYEPSVLKQLDYSKFTSFHAQILVVTCLGFFTDSYAIFISSVVGPFIAFSRFSSSYRQTKSSIQYGAVPLGIDIIMKVSLLLGTAVGQILFGWLGDIIGRKAAMGYTLLLIIVFTTLDVSVTSSSGVSTTAFVAIFCIFRFFTGITIGGEYPLTAVFTSEWAGRDFRGKMIAIVFLSQGLGLVAGVAVSLLMLAIFKDDIYECTLYSPCTPLDSAWRLAMALTLLPAITTYVLRWRLPESPRFTTHVLSNPMQAHYDVKYMMEGSVREYRLRPLGPPNRIRWEAFSSWLNTSPNKGVGWTRAPRQELLSMCVSWFLLDVVYYSQNMFLPNILSELGVKTYVGPNATGEDIYKMLTGSLQMRLLVQLMGTVPGYLFAVLLVERMGRKVLQYVGFVAMCIILVIIAVLDATVGSAGLQWLLLQLYAFLFFFSNFGPNTTTFIMPAEAFPTAYRALCFGIAAAAGKLGAVVGVAGLGYLSTTHPDLKVVVVALLAFTSLLGVFSTLPAQEAGGKSLEEISGDRDTATTLLINAEERERSFRVLQRRAAPPGGAANASTAAAAASVGTAVGTGSAVGTGNAAGIGNAASVMDDAHTPRR